MPRVRLSLVDEELCTGLNDEGEGEEAERNRL